MSQRFSHVQIPPGPGVTIGVYVTELSLEVDTLFVFQDKSSTHHAGIVAETVSAGVIPETVNSKVVPSFGLTSTGFDETNHVVPVSDMSHKVKVAILIGSLNTALKVALPFVDGSA